MIELFNSFGDQIAVGEDGPTHKPIEQLSMFRTTPNTNFFRPADANDAIEYFGFTTEKIVKLYKSL